MLVSVVVVATAAAIAVVAAAVDVSTSFKLLSLLIIRHDFIVAEISYQHL